MENERYEVIFGDGTFGSDSVTSHVYNEQGEFNVLLTITTEANCIDTISYKVLIDEYDLDKNLLRPVEKILDTICSSGDSVIADSLILDLGLVRGIAYYTGVVFEILDVNSDLILCGGGRYAGLIKALGAEEDVSAMGFAYNVESMVKSLGG